MQIELKKDSKACLGVEEVNITKVSLSKQEVYPLEVISVYIYFIDFADEFMT